MKEYKILIVDDDSDKIWAIQRYFVEAGEPYRVYQSLTGELALKIAGNELPDLIITDWEMPEMDGIELINNLKQNPKTTDIPIIMCTGVMISSENLQTALMAGAVDFVRFPIDKIELIARVRSMLQLADSKKEIKQKLSIIERKSRFIDSLMESIPSPFVYYKPSGIIKSFNLCFATLLGKEQSQILNTPIYDLPYFNDVIHLSKDNEILDELVGDSYEYSIEDKTYFFVKNIYYGLSSTPEGILCVITDISELKQAHRQIIENKKKELASNVLRLIHVSKMNNKLVNELENIYEAPESVKNKLIKRAITRFDMESGNKIWQEFELRLTTVFDSFYSAIKQLYPDLTPGEIKLCAFLRLSLTTKDIATITFQSTKSIEMARYRLRGKMNLSHDENLTKLLMGID